MQINLATFRESLPKNDPPPKLEHYSPGVFRAIEAAHYESLSNQVDWGSFTLEEAEQALEYAMGYVGDDCDYDFDEDPRPNEWNAIHQFLHSTEAIYRIKETKPERQTSEVQFF
ncbi:hypothetical protein Theco_4078 (plasmid) [Thermobacillus composti KWC4]|jgi:hypothetical protein|uniref:Uncharacterized protein n=1 Tax=Thermobacillus composti (strain DSM 18247 / JCM 13945 / KWC4) TaxID=717605 RepID=L0EIJ6_THECK|nr:hypothetical protein [Thermobacillus composti]AGA60078.1 hypothetical protein Theco_4078 [Thermobacillus composti KWC4]